MNMCVYVYTYTYICLFIYIYESGCEYMYMCVYICMCAYIHIYLRTYICFFFRICITVCGYKCVHMCFSCESLGLCTGNYGEESGHHWSRHQWPGLHQKLPRRGTGTHLLWEGWRHWMLCRSLFPNQGLKLAGQWKRQVLATGARNSLDTFTFRLFHLEVSANTGCLWSLFFQIISLFCLLS